MLNLLRSPSAAWSSRHESRHGRPRTPDYEEWAEGPLAPPQVAHPLAPSVPRPVHRSRVAVTTAVSASGGTRRSPAGTCDVWVMRSTRVSHSRCVACCELLARRPWPGQSVGAHDASEAQVRRPGVDHLRLPGGGPVA